MSDHLQNYNQTWEQEYYYHDLQPVGDQFSSLYQEFADISNVVPTNNFDDSRNSLVRDETTTLTNANVAANMYTNPTITSPGKSKRRRSKGASSKSTTFLNASVTNFRALVQQHTGCHTSTPSPKGPITLCFAAASSSSNSSSYQDSIKAVNSLQATQYQINHQYYH